MMNARRPIGIFDSGVGGLTVFREIRRQYPHEDIVYFGDTARVPYGPKSRETVINYSIQNARFLLQLGAKIIVVACNTAASVALPALQKRFPVPVIGVIEPGARMAVEATRNRRIGVIGTEGTIRSQAYGQAIHRIDPNQEVLGTACPLFVPLAEEGWEEHPVTRSVAEEYLENLLGSGIDTLVLGCTHYPILKETLQKVVGESVTLIDSAEAIAHHLKNILPEPQQSGEGHDQFFVSDNEQKFEQIARKILQNHVKPLRKVGLGETWFLENLEPACQ